MLPLKHLPVSAPLRGLKHLFRRHDLFLARVLGDRAKAIDSAQMAELACLPEDEYRKRVGQVRSGEWRMLPGNFPELARWFDDESRRLDKGTAAA